MDTSVNTIRRLKGKRSIGCLHFGNRLLLIKQFISLGTRRNRPWGTVLTEVESSQFISYHQRIHIGNIIFITEPYSVIENPETKGQLHLILINQIDSHFIIMVPVGFIFSPRLRPCFIFAVECGFLYPEASSQNNTVSLHKTHFWIFYQQWIIYRHIIKRSTILIYRQRHLDVTVRWFYFCFRTATRTTSQHTQKRYN